ncbi:MAG: amidohydrolase [Chitinophagaceae bacterium]|nr:amidohydrolase [Chitinophagaceae bacterium]
MKKYLSIFASLLIVFLSSCNLISSSSQKQAADHIYINAIIWTGDSANPKATAIAIKDSLIIFVGDEYKNYKGSNTQIIDVGGKMILPGFIDNHTHFLNGGYQLASVDLKNSKTPNEFISSLKNYVSRLQEKRWIQGGNWDHEAWGGELPRKEWIDSITGDNPVFLSRYDGHMALANSLTLKLAGIDKNTRNPAGGEIVKDATGEPTGVLKDEAMGLVNKIIPDPTPKELDEALQRAVQHAYENGVTQINDMGSYGGWIDMETYKRAYNSNGLNFRIYSFVAISTWRKLDSLVKKEGRGNDMLRWGGLKGFVDGSLGSTTAWFYKPYLDAPNTTGLQVTDTNFLRQWILQADSAGLHVAVHAIGDRANDWLLNVYEEAEKRNHSPRAGGAGRGLNSRFRIEHAQHLTQAAIPRFAALQVIPSMQPYHAIDDGRWAAKRLDNQRLKGTYAFKSLLDAGARLTFGSDWPVAPLKPLEGIYAAVTRRTLDGKNPNGWYPEQKITVEQALRCYTVNNAYAGFHENKTGMLKAGMLADFIVISDNILTIAPERIPEIKVLRTVINGKEVYVRK